MSDALTEETIARDLAALSRKTGLLIRPLDAEAMNKLFAELERYDAEERRATFEYLKRAMNETRASLGAEPVYTDE